MENAFMDFVDADGDVESWIKISETRHRFATISYMRTDGLLATYHPDFIVETNDSLFLVETKGADKVKDRNVQQKRRAATEWCEKINQLPEQSRNGKEWEYILLGEDTFYGLSMNGATLTDIFNHCRVSSAMVQGVLSF